MLRDIANWKARSPALKAMDQASPEVRLEFLNHSFEWLKAQTKERHNFRITSTLREAIAFALQGLSKPLPAETVATLLSDLCRDAWTRGYFPFDEFLAVLTREEITEGMRGDLRSIYLQYAPSSTGKIDKHSVAVRSV